MSYVKKLVIVPDEYQGETFIRNINKKSGLAWDANEIADYAMYDSDGLVVSTDLLTKSVDNLSLVIKVPSTDTVSLEGKHKLLVNLKDSNDATISDVIAEYEITYKVRTA